MEKLVRDKIPEIIREKGETADFYIADDHEYYKRLCLKLLEEAQELIESENDKEAIEEIADIREVLAAIVSYRQFQEVDVETVRLLKKEKRGGFIKKYILKS